ncbi:MAG: hypothetical protein R3C69_09500 [Geminicoccaceae bacterium]
MSGDQRAGFLHQAKLDAVDDENGFGGDDEWGGEPAVPAIAGEEIRPTDQVGQRLQPMPPGAQRDGDTRPVRQGLELGEEAPAQRRLARGLNERDLTRERGRQWFCEISPARVEISADVGTWAVVEEANERRARVTRAALLSNRCLPRAGP